MQEVFINVHNDTDNYISLNSLFCCFFLYICVATYSTPGRNDWTSPSFRQATHATEPAKYVQFPPKVCVRPTVSLTSLYLP